MKLTIGIGSSSPMTSLSHPHWKIATATPRLSEMLSRMPMAALMGTTKDRNTTSSRMRVSPITMPMKRGRARSEEHTSELQSLMRNSYAVFCLKKKKKQKQKRDKEYKINNDSTI